MIDVVFQLVMFFMVVTEVTKTELEEMTLPTAVTGISEKKDPIGRLIINVTWDPIRQVSKIIIQRRVHDLNALRARLQTVADATRQASTAAGPPTSDVLVKIRGDERVPYENVMMVMAQCARVFIYKISFAVRESKELK
jgi:biopolymer transport protein ExbD